jgi:moderate conductance mechanosensitive channel
MIKTDFWANLGTNLADGGWLLAKVAATILIAFLLSWILRLVIRRVVRQIVSGVKKNQNVSETQALVASPLAAVRVVQRTRTLGTVLSNIVNVVIGIIALVLVFNYVAPGAIGSLALLTAAIGAGLGFGAQNIVKDVFNGLFMVMEDQLGVGDVVDLGLATGAVEAVGIRVTQVRDVNGVLWFVRNGEIVRVGNVSQGWSRVIVDLAVPYETDIDEVQQRLLATANELAATPKWRPRIIEKPELWGIASISADALVIRIVLKTRSTYKDDVARELRLRLKKTTDDMGIKLPSLNSVVLSGFDEATSISGAHVPRTNPVPVIEGAKPKKSRSRRAPAKAVADPRALPVVDPTRPITKPHSKPDVNPPQMPPTGPEA